jgi:CHASE2 domain-containing sensor protein
MTHYLNQLISGLKRTFSNPVRPFYGFVAGAIILTTIAFYLQSTPLIQDWEQRFQSNYYPFSAFLKPPETALSSLIVVLINDQSLPEGVSRSPIDRRWLQSLIEKVSGHQPALIGLNILLDRPQNLGVDQALAATFAKSGNIILRSDPYYPPLTLFSNAALDQGTLRFRFDSSGTVQAVCHSPLSCRSEKIFQLRLLKHLRGNLPGSLSAPTEMQSDWMRIDFSASQHLSSGKKIVKFPVIFANELESVPQGALQDKIVLIGSGFPDLYPLYRTPLASEEHFLQETEILARIVEMMIGNRYLKPVPGIYSAMVLLMLLLALSLLLSIPRVLPGFWFTLVALPALFFLAAISFTLFRLIIPLVLPASLLLLFYVVGIIQRVLHEQYARLMTELKLKEAKIDFLTNELHTHHLFNELSRLNVMIGQHPATARAYLVEFAELLRASLKYGDQPRVPVSVQMDYLNTYTRQQSIIHGDDMRFEFEISGDWEAVYTPWHLFFPLVENAVKQTEGALRQKHEQPLAIEIALRKENDRLHFTVKNPFLTDANVHSAGKGLANLSERLKWAYPGGESQLSSHQQNQDWIATLQLPLS